LLSSLCTRSGELACVGIEGSKDSLDSVHFLAFEHSLATLAAHPGGNGVPMDMVSSPVDVEWRTTTSQLTLTMYAFGRGGVNLL